MHPQIQFCWIQNDLWRLLFYIPLFLQIMYNMYAHCKVYAKTGSTGITYLLVYFPTIELICWLPIGVMRLIDGIKPCALSYWPAFLMWCFSRSPPIVHSFLFGWATKICHLCNSKEKDSTDSSDSGNKMSKFADKFSRLSSLSFLDDSKR